MTTMLSEQESFAKHVATKGVEAAINHNVYCGGEIQAIVRSR